MRAFFNSVRSFLASLAVIIFVQSPVAAQTYKTPTGPVFDRMVKAFSGAMATGDLAGVEAALPAMEKAFPGHPYTLFFKGFYHQASGSDIPGALKEYSEAIRLMPDLDDPYRFRAGILADKGLFDRAVADMDNVIRIAGKDASAVVYSDRATFKSRGGYHEEAFDDFKIAVSMEPANPKYYRGLVNTAMDMKDPAAAEAVLSAALNGTQKGAGAIRTAYGDLLLRQQKFAEADIQFKLAVATAGYTPDAQDLNMAAIAAMKMKDYSRAVNLSERAMAANPRDGSLIVNRASIAMEQQAWEDVYTYSQKALLVDPDNAMVNGMMAVGVSRTGRGDALAEKYMTRAKQLEAAGQ